MSKGFRLPVGHDRPQQPQAAVQFQQPQQQASGPQTVGVPLSGTQIVDLDKLPKIKLATTVNPDTGKLSHTEIIAVPTAIPKGVVITDSDPKTGEGGGPVDLAVLADPRVMEYMNQFHTPAERWDAAVKLSTNIKKPQENERARRYLNPHQLVGKNAYVLPGALEDGTVLPDGVRAPFGPMNLPSETETPQELLAMNAPLPAQTPNGTNPANMMQQMFQQFMSQMMANGVGAFGTAPGIQTPQQQIQIIPAHTIPAHSLPAHTLGLDPQPNREPQVIPPAGTISVPTINIPNNNLPPAGFVPGIDSMSPEELEAHPRVQELMHKARLEALQLMNPGWQLPPAKPEWLVEFDFGQIGKFQNWYHAAQIGTDFLVLITDNRYEGSRWSPPSITDRTVIVRFPSLKEPRSFEVVSSDSQFRWGAADFLILPIERDISQPQKPPAMPVDGLTIGNILAGGQNGEAGNY